MYQHLTIEKLVDTLEKLECKLSAIDSELDNAIGTVNQNHGQIDTLFAAFFSTQDLIRKANYWLDLRQRELSGEF